MKEEKYCEVLEKKQYTEKIRRWDRETRADGDELGADIEKLVNNDAYLKENIEQLENPEFSDSGSVTGIASFPDFLAKVKSKMNIFGFFRDFAAGMKFVLHTGQLVNNCLSERTDLPLAAKQGKVLAEEMAKLNSYLTPATDVHGSLLDFALSCKQGITIFCTGSVTTDAPFVYCTGEILVRGRDFKIVAYNLQSGEVATNRKTNNMSNWDGWTKLIIDSDLTPIWYQVPQPEETNIFLSFNHWNVDLIKSGHIVTLRLNINGEMAATDDIKPLFTLPEKYRPSFALIWNYITQAGDRMLIEIKPSGEVLLSNFGKTLSGGTSNNNAWFCRQCIIYIIN